MKNKNSRMNRLKALMSARWSSEDHPGGQARFQAALFSKDVGVFILLPLSAVILYRTIDHSGQPQKRSANVQQASREPLHSESSKSQIIEFRPVGASAGGTVGKRTPGSLVKVRLLNVVETYSSAPVHAQIVDGGLGKSLLGGTLVGDANPDPTYERISISFRYARDPSRDSVAYPISARALSLDGTLGVVASKKEAFFTRAVLGSAASSSQNAQVKGDSTDLKDILFRALAAGFVQEFSAGSQVEKSRSQVLSLRPDTEFFAELTDFFSGVAK